MRYLEKAGIDQDNSPLFFDEESEATAATPFTSRGSISDPLTYCPFKDKEYVFSYIFKKGFDSYRSGIETRESKRGILNEIDLLILGQKEFRSSRIWLLPGHRHKSGGT